jgi:chromosome segregation ATPase
MLKDEIIELKKRLVDLESEKNKHAVKNKRDVEDLTYQLSKAQEKVARFVDKKIEREQKISDLMNKIKSTPTRKHDIIAAKQKIEELERRYKLLASKKAFRKEKLDALKQRIDELKQKLPAEI